MNIGMLLTDFLTLHLAKQQAKIALLFTLLLLSSLTWAQTPIGLYEGFMGNAGAAISESMAPSYYNPSLLRYRKTNTYKLSANTFDQFSSQEGATKQEAASFVPGYLSGIYIGDTFNHEFFLVGLTPLKVQFTGTETNSGLKTNIDGQEDRTSLFMGYTMAAKSIPLAFSYFAIYNQTDALANSETFNVGGDFLELLELKGQIKSLQIGLSISSHIRFKKYTFGYQYRSRTLKLYEESSGKAATFIPNGAGGIDKTTYNFKPSTTASSGEQWVLGHGFKMDSVEILTDTFFEEKQGLSHIYKVFQSFGLRVFSKNEHQFLVGFKQQIGNQVDYIGQSTYTSCGYSWKTRGSRSSVGLYHYIDKVEENLTKIGLSFSSEMAY